MGRSHGSGGGGRSHSSGGGGGRSHSSGGGFRSGGSSFSRHHVSRVPGSSYHSSSIHHHRHIGGPHIHTSVHVSGPTGGIIAIVMIYIIFFLVPMFVSFSGVNQRIDEITTSYYYYQDMISYANQNSGYKKKGVVKGIYQDSQYDDAWYLKYTVYNPNNAYQIYVTEYTFSVYSSEDISKIKLGDEIWIAVDNPTPPIFDSIDMNYSRVSLEEDPEYAECIARKKSLTTTFTIYGIIATSIAGILLFVVIKAIVKKSKQENSSDTSLSLGSETTTPAKPKTQYCEYCGVALDSGSDKCKVCGARSNKQ